MKARQNLCFRKSLRVGSLVSLTIPQYNVLVVRRLLLASSISQIQEGRTSPQLGPQKKQPGLVRASNIVPALARAD
jgi:hypothetical protein